MLKKFLAVSILKEKHENKNNCRGDSHRRSSGIDVFCKPGRKSPSWKQDPQAGDPLSRLNFTVGGSIRAQFDNTMGDKDKTSYKRNGYDGGTRFRFAADYYLFDDISWISYYELGVNVPAVFDWDSHYAEGSNYTSRRMLYTGLKSKTRGTMTFGQQNSVYYDVVGAKTDVWDYDMKARGRRVTV